MSFVLCVALALAGCEGTSSDGEAGSGNAGSGGMSGGTSGAGGGGGHGGGSGASGGSGGAGAGGSGSGGSSGTGGAGAGGNGGDSGAGGQGGGGAGGDSMPDAGQDAGPLPSDCSGGGYLICEDFEDTALGEVPEGWSKFGDPVGVADDQAVSGTKSLKMSESSDWRRMQRDGSSLPTTHWGRIRYRVDADVPDPLEHSTMVSFIGDSPANDSQVWVRVVDTVKEPIEGWGGDGNGNHYQYLYNVQRIGVEEEFGKGGPYESKFDGEWHCVEWYISSATQAYRFFADGDEIEDMAFENGAGVYENSEIPTTFDEVHVGWVTYQGGTFTAWIDDLAIATQRVGCD